MFGIKRQKRKPSGKAAPRNGVRPRRSSGPTARRIFHGVAIVADSQHACTAVGPLTGVRYLADEAPILPVQGCSNPAACRCKYQHFEDRRTDARRESDVGLPVKDHPNDARTGTGRRVTDG